MFLIWISQEEKNMLKLVQHSKEKKELEQLLGLKREHRLSLEIKMVPLLFGTQSKARLFVIF